MRKRCIDMVYELAKKDPRVVFVGSDLSPGLLSEMQRDFPDRYFMEGISEANVIGMAAGLALRGYIPYVNTIATFNSSGRCMHAQTSHSPHFKRRWFGLCTAWADAPCH